jgi:hypothetical protein
MGANAQTTVPLFATGDELTAAGGNLLTNGVAVFSGTATRDAAFGGPSEKVLAEGQACYLEDSDQVQIYTGAAFVNLAGLRVVKSSTSFSTAVEPIPNIFSASYLNYEVHLDITSFTVASASVTMQFRTGGSSVSTNNYFQTAEGQTDTDASNSITLISALAVGAKHNVVIKILSPFTSTFTLGEFSQTQQSSTAMFYFANGFGFNLTTSFDGMSIAASVGTITGTYTVYGYAN